jgi:tetratricopeptide (TPR) repeat protein
LNQNANLSLDYCESVLEALHQEVPFWGGTQYSTLYNLTDGKINLYYFHDYNRSVQLDLKEELRKGNHVLNIPEMFPEVRNGHEYMANYDEYEKNLLLLENDDTFSDPEIFSRVAREIVNGPPKKIIYANFYKIESIGKAWLAKGNYDNAISVFKINTGVFDWIAGPFDNLAHAYMLDDQYDMAITNYNRVLEITPDDENAAAQLQQIAILNNKSDE